MPFAFRSFARTAAIFLLPAIALGLHVAYYFPFIADDALISLRYAHRLIDGHGLTWTDGIRVEGYSNLLWTLGCAGLGALGMDLVLAARILGMLGSLAVLHALWFRYGRGSNQHRTGFLVAAFILACSGSFAVWTIGGLEQPLFAALLTWVIVLCFEMLDSAMPRVNNALMIGMLLGCIAINRPDGGLFIAAIALSLFAGLRGSAVRWNILFAVTIPAMVFVAAQLGFRLWYYGEWIPNTALVKLSFSPHYAWIGIKQDFWGLVFLAPVIALIVQSLRKLHGTSGIGLTTPIGKKLFLIVVCVAMWIGYSALSGGDIFPALRAFVPVVVLLAFAAAESISFSQVSRRQSFLAAGLIMLFLAGQLISPGNRWAKGERWEWHGRSVGLMLKERFGATQPLLAIRAAGAVPYWSELPCLDLYGLNDYYIPRHRPPSFGTGAPSHELGNPDYVFAVKPDLIILGGPDGILIGDPMKDDLVRDPRFSQQYTNIVFLMSDHSILTSLWVRNDSRKVDLDALRRESDAMHNSR